jgi:hypothetical protein
MIAYAAAVPTAWPIVAQVFWTRSLPKTTWLKLASLPAKKRFDRSFETSERSGVEKMYGTT